MEEQCPVCQKKLAKRAVKIDDIVETQSRYGYEVYCPNGCIKPRIRNLTQEEMKEWG